MSFDLDSRLGALPSPWDIRHYRVPRATLLMAIEYPEEMLDLIDLMPPIQNQGNIGSCVGHDGDMVRSATYKLKNNIDVNLSAGWLYARSRFYANVPDHIEGSTNLGLMKALHKEGATTEDCAPTDTQEPFEMDECDDAEEIALSYKIDSYWNVNSNPNDIKGALMGWTHEAEYTMPDGSPGKIPLVTAFGVYNTFSEGYDDGIVPLPQSGDRLRGGHSSAIIGWKIIDDETYWINHGSWGTDIGDEGVFYLPENYPFYTNDVWIIHSGDNLPPPEPEPSPCPLGNAWAKLNNVLPWVLGRKGRFSYVNRR